MVLCCPCTWATSKGDGYIPSCIARVCFAKLFGPNFDPEAIVSPKTDEKKGKILVIGTDKSKYRMENGKEFITGHNISEMFVPILHMECAGYEFEFATATGNAFALEEWSWIGPKYHKTEAALRHLMGRVPGYKNPIQTNEALPKFVAGEYVGVFFPGGHGTMIELGNPPDGGATSKILAHAHAKQITTMTLCHGPQSLLAAPKGTYDGYKVAGYPDKDDLGANVMSGYLPGKPPGKMMRAGLIEKFPGMTFINKEANADVSIDRELISGAGPLAAHNVGLECVKALARAAPITVEMER